MSTVTNRGADASALRMWTEYVSIGGAIYADNISAVAKDLVDGLGKHATIDDMAKAVYDKSVSLSQGAKSRKGGLINALVATVYSDFFGGHVQKISRELKLRPTGKADIDLYIELPRGAIYSSITTIPQERKDGTWPEEQDLVHNYHKLHGIKTPYVFLPIFFETSGTKRKRATVEETRRKWETLESQLRPGWRHVIAVQDVDHHAEILREIMGTFT